MSFYNSNGTKPADIFDAYNTDDAIAQCNINTGAFDVDTWLLDLSAYIAAASAPHTNVEFSQDVQPDDLQSNSFDWSYGPTGEPRDLLTLPEIDAIWAQLALTAEATAQPMAEPPTPTSFAPAKRTYEAVVDDHSPSPNERRATKKGKKTTKTDAPAAPPEQTVATEQDENAAAADENATKKASKLFTCLWGDCNRSFKRARDWDRHMDIHPKKHRYHCPGCTDGKPEGWSRIDSFENHFELYATCKEAACKFPDVKGAGGKIIPSKFELWPISTWTLYALQLRTPAESDPTHGYFAHARDVCLRLLGISTSNSAPSAGSSSQRRAPEYARFAPTENFDQYAPEARLYMEQYVQPVAWCNQAGRQPLACQIQEEVPQPIALPQLLPQLEYAGAMVPGWHNYPSTALPQLLPQLEYAGAMVPEGHNYPSTALPQLEDVGAIAPWWPIPAPPTLPQLEDANLFTPSDDLATSLLWMAGPGTASSSSSSSRPICPLPRRHCAAPPQLQLWF